MVMDAGVRQHERSQPRGLTLPSKAAMLEFGGMRAASSFSAKRVR